MENWNNITKSLAFLGSIPVLGFLCAYASATNSLLLAVLLVVFIITAMVGCAYYFTRAMDE